MNGPLDDLAQVMGGNIGDHTHSDTGRSRYQEVGETCRKHHRFLEAVIIVGLEVDGVLVEVIHHLPTQAGQTGLCIAVGSWRIAITGSKVAMAVDQGMAHGKILGHPDQGIVDALVAMGVKAPQDITNGGGTLAVGLVPGKALGIHGIKDAAVNRLEPVPYIRQGPVRNDAHGIIDEGFFHLLIKVHGYDDIVRILKSLVYGCFTRLIIVLAAWLQSHLILPAGRIVRSE